MKKEHPKKIFDDISDNMKKIITETDDMEKQCNEFHSKGKDWVTEDKLKELIDNVKPIPVPKSLYPTLRKYNNKINKITKYSSYGIDDVQSLESEMQYSERMGDFKQYKTPNARINFALEVSPEIDKPDEWFVEIVPDQCKKSYGFKTEKCMKNLQNNMDFTNKLFTDKAFLTTILDNTVKQNIEEMERDKKEKSKS